MEGSTTAAPIRWALIVKPGGYVNGEHGLVELAVNGRMFINCGSCGN